MGRKVSILVTFLREALENSKYGPVLNYIDQINEIFELNLTRKSTNMDAYSIKLLQDWNAIKERESNFQTNYSISKQRFLMALRRSKYLKFVSTNKTGIQYRFLTKDEIEARTNSGTLQANIDHSSDDGSSSPIEVTDSISLGAEITSSSTSSDVENFRSQSDCSSVTAGSIFREFNEQNSQCSNEISHSLQSGERELLHIINHPSNIESIELDARLVSEDQWMEVEEYLYDRKKSMSSNLELHLYRYKSETRIDNDFIILCEREKDRNLACDLKNAEFPEDCPGIIANTDLLKRFLSYQVSVIKQERGRLLLYLTSNPKRDIYATYVISDKIIFKNSEYFILYYDFT